MPRAILLPLDPTKPASWPLALTEAQLLISGGGVLHVLNVVPDYGFGAMGAIVTAALEQTALPQMRQALRLWLGQNLPVATLCEPHVRTGDVASAILSLAREIKADVIVLGVGVNIGDTARVVIEDAEISVYLVRG
jgi:nucleotide-binding universal stress UspA family protein